MSRTPNSEQLKAINTDKGLLLQAGAGSGKTFVIVEHVIHKITNWINGYSVNKDQDFSKYIKDKLGTIVLMTFTVPAAGEMSIRLEERIKILMSRDDEMAPYWQEVFRIYHAITVTTIHGFCFKLIRQGFFRDINIESRLISANVLRLFIKDFLSSWLISAIEKRRFDQSLIDQVLLHRQIFIDALLSILSDSSVLCYWEENKTGELKHIWGELSLYFAGTTTFDYVDGLEEHRKTSWAPFLMEFQNRFNALPYNEEEFKKIFLFFENLEFKIPRTPSGKTVSESIKQKFKAVKELKDGLKKYADSFKVFWNTPASWEEWNSIFGSIVADLIKSYRSYNFMTFTDMEYLVWKGLECNESRTRISERYQYLIVDEFQDTSKMQYEIITSVVENDLSKLYLVGDLKQAIYGFRGGEVSVFRDCLERMPESQILKINYRSGRNIINFNNNFFKYLFPRPYKEGEIEDQIVPVEDQNTHENTADGKMTLISVPTEVFSDGNEEEVQTFSTAHIEEIEAKAIARYLQKNQGNGQTAILYRKLAPSKFLIEELSKLGIGFTTQVKIQLSEDPVFALFKILIEGFMDVGGKYSIYSSLVISALLEQLNVNHVPQLENHISAFFQNSRYFGSKVAFSLFLQNIHISIPNYKDSLEVIEKVIERSGGEIEKIYQILGEMAEKSYSLKLKFGSTSEKVLLMTTHASKGLQFDKVVVAGIYTNDMTRSNSDLIGKVPMSFQWTENQYSKTKLKSPSYIWENESNKRREYHESKRLFYVACTRAENELIFVDINWGMHKLTKNSSHSWVNLLKDWYALANDEFTKFIIDEKFVLNSKSISNLPLFHSNPLGIVKKVGDDVQSAIIPELSATRLLSLYQCPKKFYFQNICRFEEEGFELFYQEASDIEEIQGPISSKVRGIKIHEQVADYIASNFTKLPAQKSTESDGILWVGKLLTDRIGQCDFISEKLIKFNFFGHMMTAIPDLYVVDKSSQFPIEVWDFKTGHRDNLKDEEYQVQLDVYVQALSDIFWLSDNYQIKTVICYIDDKVVVEKTQTVAEVRASLMLLWKKALRPWEENLNHCNSCVYKSICQI